MLPYMPVLCGEFEAKHPVYVEENEQGRKT